MDPTILEKLIPTNCVILFVYVINILITTSDQAWIKTL